MKKIYILGILAILILAVGPASAAVVNYDITASNQDPSLYPINIKVAYDQSTNILTFTDQNTNSAQGIVGVLYEAPYNSITDSFTTTPSNTNGWEFNGGAQSATYGHFTTTIGKSSNTVYKTVTVQLAPWTIIDQNTAGYYVAVHYKWTDVTGFGAGTPTTPTPIPEFPTIALPVAGILGLMLILGRRNKE